MFDLPGPCRVEHLFDQTGADRAAYRYRYIRLSERLFDRCSASWQLTGAMIMGDGRRPERTDPGAF